MLWFHFLGCSTDIQMGLGQTNLSSSIHKFGYELIHSGLSAE